MCVDNVLRKSDGCAKDFPIAGATPAAYGGRGAGVAFETQCDKEKNFSI
jgi:hypothetical protein